MPEESYSSLRYDRIRRAGVRAALQLALFALATGELQAQRVAPIDSERPPPTDDERPPRTERAPAPRTGMFLRTTLGAEATSTVTELPEGAGLETPITMSGVGLGLDLDLGYAPSSVYAIHVRAVLTGISDPTIEAEGMSGQANDTHLLASAFGLAGTYYPLPFLYATAAVGLSQMTLDVTLGDQLQTASTDFGLWLNGDIGVEVPISSVHFGVGMRVQYAAMPSGDGGDVRYTSAGGFASLTYLEP